MRTRVNNLGEMDSFAASFVGKIVAVGERKKALVVGLAGDLGSGKTTFVKAAALALGIKNTVTSPTFVIEKIYKLPKRAEKEGFSHLIHIDAYRLEGGEELEALGWSNVASDPANLIFIEWPERVKEILPDDMVNMEFEFMDENVREVEIN
ncbi:MAG: tRNA (adenosine(37)-N6)-threonylcarbamoyltransferase complex ATPase subunit type 1 TsaE [Patescibacteria group bacterium]|nr:MAG: tRNA (adenosine(37)-N6)-threonylcarbamoyltransferase complex ATPase subunit type 1 TsaE [Patescibacteria group bacterium]